MATKAIRSLCFFLIIHLTNLVLPSKLSSTQLTSNNEFSNFLREPIIFSNQLGENIYKDYSWAGTSISQFYKWQTQKIAEIWFNSTQKDGLTKLPGIIETLDDLIQYNPQDMLGLNFTKKPIFCKILGKNEKLPHILHSGFNNSIIENDQVFIELCILERSLIVKLQQQLCKYIHDAYQFQCYKEAYDEWTSQEIRCQWHNLTLIPHLPLFMSSFDTSIFNQLREVREKLVSFLNEIQLHKGLVVLSPVGNIHSIVGSHQMHPPAGHPETKNEAYYIFSAGHDKDSNELLLYFEPQQTSNTTYSPFDFASPIEFKNGNVILRKDLTKGLDALLDNTHLAPKDESDAIRLMLSKAIHFKPTLIDDLILNDKIQDITNSCRYSNAVNSKAQSLIEGTYAPTWNQAYFTLEQIRLYGKNKGNASIQIHPIHNCYHELFIIKGTVTIHYGKNQRSLPQGSAVFIPACYSQTYTIDSMDNAKILRVYPS